MPRSKWHPSNGRGAALCCRALTVVVSFGMLRACFLIHADCPSALVVEGQVLDVVTGAALTQARLGARTVTAGEQTAIVTPLTSWGSPRVPIPDEQGMFNIELWAAFVACPAPDFPDPDQLEMIVAREALPLALDPFPEQRTGEDLRIVCPCEERFSIEVNDDTAEMQEDIDALGTDRLRLKQPIVVSDTCEACCGLLVVRGQLTGGITPDDGTPSFTVWHTEEGPDPGRRFWAPQRQRVESDGAFEAWFSEHLTCPPDSALPRPDEFSVRLGQEDCARLVNVAITADNADLSVDNTEASFPKTVLTLREPVVIPACKP